MSAVYFVLFMFENVKVILGDFVNFLYDVYYLNFVSVLLVSVLEELATSAVRGGVDG